MGKKRMFSSDVIDTDSFLDMTRGAKLLYFYLGMHADDDGFVSSPQMFVRAIKCRDCDLAELVKTGFVIAFDSGVIAIRDWRINNDLKNDRYHPTIYAAEKAMLTPDASKRYVLVSKAGADCTQRVSETETELNVTEPNVTEPNVTEQNKTEREQESADKPPRPRFSPPGVEEVEAYCRERKNGIDAQRFVDFYTANGWVQNRNKPIKDWRAAVRTWEGREKNGRHDHGHGRENTPIPGGLYL